MNGHLTKRPRLTTLLAFIGGAVLAAIATWFVAKGLAARGWFTPETPEITDGNFGQFLSNPKFEALGDGRNVRLLDDFIYVDPRGKAWLAPKDSIVNGASIPQVFWSVLGGPFEGKYRNASVVHDVECDRMKTTWEDVHLMFYEACRCGGMSESDAKTLYAAVYRFGPKWELRSVQETRMITNADGTEEAIVVETQVAEVLLKAYDDPTEEQVKKLRALIEQQDLSLEQIQNIDLSEL